MASQTLNGQIASSFLSHVLPATGVKTPGALQALLQQVCVPLRLCWKALWLTLDCRCLVLHADAPTDILATHASVAGSSYPMTPLRLLLPQGHSSQCYGTALADI